MVIKIIDTNVIIRFLTRDHQEWYQKAENLFKQAQDGKIAFYLDEVVAAETVWLLDSFYEYPREKIAKTMLRLVSQDWMQNPRKKLIISALALFSKTRISYIDCWQKIVSEETKLEIVSFDKKLNKLV